MIIFYGKKYTDTVEMAPHTTRKRQNVPRSSPNSQLEAIAPLLPSSTTLIKKPT